MGGDGGTCCKRRDIMTKTYQEKRKQDRDYEVNALWTFCSISGKQLKRPIVSCELGRLYNKDSILEFLLDRGKQPEETQRRLAHIKRMKDVKELKLAKNPSFRVDKNGATHGAEYHCPISNLEMNGRHKFGFVLQTGTVLSERAIKQLVKSSGDGTLIDPYDDKKYSIDDIIYINIGFALEEEAEFAEIKKKMKKRVEAKKLAKAQKRGIEGKTDEEKVVKKKKRPLIVPQKVETNTINSKLNTITAASIQQGREAVKSQKVQSETLSSLFTSHDSFIGDVDAETLNGRTANLQTGRAHKIKGGFNRTDKVKELQEKLHTFRYKAGGLNN